VSGKVIFSLTADQAAMLSRLEAGDELEQHMTSSDRRTKSSLYHKGLIRSSPRGIGYEPTPLGKAACALAARLANPTGKSKR
jgi:hypothetical protein